VYPVHKGRFLKALTLGKDKLRNLPVGQQHKFLDQQVSILPDLFDHIHREGVLIQLELHFFRLERDGPILKAALPQDSGNVIEFGQGVGKSPGTALDLLLRLLVVEALIRVYDGAPGPLVMHIAPLPDLENG